MGTAGASVRSYPALIDWLQTHGVEYELHEHPLAFTAAETAHAEGVEPASVAKVVGVRTSDGQNALAVLDTTDQIDLAKLARALGVAWVALLGEEEFGALAPECEVGTAPPVPELVRRSQRAYSERGWT